MPNSLSTTVILIVLCIYLLYTGDQLPYSVQVVQDPQEGLQEYYQRVIGRIRMEGVELPHPVQVVQDPQEEMGEYYQRVIGRIRMEGAGLPHPVQVVEDPQEEMGEYLQRVESGEVC